MTFFGVGFFGDEFFGVELSGGELFGGEMYRILLLQWCHCYYVTLTTTITHSSTTHITLADSIVIERSYYWKFDDPHYVPLPICLMKFICELKSFYIPVNSLIWMAQSAQSSLSWMYVNMWRMINNSYAVDHLEELVHCKLYFLSNLQIMP